jgi:hypothetical protein
MEMAATGDQAGFSSSNAELESSRFRSRGFDPGISIQGLRSRDFDPGLGRLGGWRCSEMLQDRLAGTGKPILSGLL